MQFSNVRLLLAYYSGLRVSADYILRVNAPVDTNSKRNRRASWLLTQPVLVHVRNDILRIRMRIFILERAYHARRIVINYITFPIIRHTQRVHNLTGTRQKAS